jgi:hypothetical protein
VDALFAQAPGATGPGGPSLSVTDQTTGVVHSIPWPYGKPEPALGPTGASPPAGAVNGFGVTGPTGATGPG